MAWLKAVCRYAVISNWFPPNPLLMNIAACACASVKMYLTVSCIQRVGVAISAANFVDEEFNKQLLWRFSLTIHKKRFCRFIVSFELFTRPLLCYVYPGACGSTILSNQMRNSLFAQLNHAEIEMRIWLVDTVKCIGLQYKHGGCLGTSAV